ncbi:amidohydrolase [Salinigranum rubrum]|uniref:Amidohydrolase n=1 Tax=Salinigranum rubrum TaxID=755307 RepID=A0A2I8VIE5_9EURY|nr:amidohydrolase [Salinigranum rubrum]AUV81698.1 amidohydrolase [Salinigranum rubrum]
MSIEDLRNLRRDLHRHPEPAWREFYTTARIVDELETRPLDALYVGPEVLGEDRNAVPDDDELDSWMARAREAGAREDIVERLAGGYTGALAVLERGEGPTVGLRVDIDGLPILEADDDHRPFEEGFRSENEGFMHACGHDAHATIGIGVIDAILDSDFQGTLKVVFQPAEEVIGGGEPVVAGGHLDDVDYLLAVHVGLDHPSGEVVAGIDGFLAVHHLSVAFTGESSHAGARPEQGRNANLALATAVQNLHAIPRHADGATRVNAGVIEGGTASNIVAEASEMEVEVRGETTDLMEYMGEHAERIVRAAGEMHACEVEIESVARAPSAVSDPELADVVGAVASGVEGVERVLPSDALGGSEDATYLMQHVQERGGKAAYVGIGTDHPTGHHTPRFDVDEESIRIGIETLSGAIERIAVERP